jgi:hypothetical protein
LAASPIVGVTDHLKSKWSLTAWAEITEHTRRHTGMVDTAFTEVRRIIGALVAKRDGRKDAFAAVIAKAMQTRYGHDAAQVTQQLLDAGFTLTSHRMAAD